MTTVSPSLACRPIPTLALALCFALLLTFATPSADADEPDVRTAARPAAAALPANVVYAAAGAGSVLDKAGGAAPAAVGSLVVALPLLRYATLELMGTAGYARGDGAAPDDMWLRLALGARLEDSRKALRPYGALRFVHIHYATAETWKDHPADSLLGSSSAGLQHRSGMALAGGMSWLVPHSDGRVRAMLEAEVSWVPIGNPPAWAVTSELGLGYAF